MECSVLNAVRQKDVLMERFLSKVQKGPGCWLWVGAKRSSYGHGAMRVGSGRTAPVHNAHRVSYALFVGPVPADAFVCHQCDVPHCVNPGHLFLGTPKDNFWDMFNKGRYKSGFTPKLRPEDVLEIRRLSETHSRRDLSRRFGVSVENVRDIIKRRRWRHL